jgi:diguanylate cyclase (GGDEF)-like protein/PAS domain S-box-containing protein
MSLSFLRPWSAAPLAPTSHEDRRRLELLLFRLTLAVAPLLLVNWLLVPSRAPLAALLSLLLIPLYGVLVLGAIRLRPSLLLRPRFGLLLFALQAFLILVQIWAYDRPGSPLWLAFLPGVLAAAARWQLPGVGLSLAWFSLDRVVTVLGFSGLSEGQRIQELTLELAVMSVMGVIFGFLFKELEVHRQRLRASTQSLTAVLENVGEAILTVDARGLVGAANLAAGELFGCDPSALIGGGIGDLLPAYTVSLHDLAHHPGRSQRHDAQGVRRDRSGFTAEVVTSLIVGDGGPVRILVLRDITELRAQTAALSHQALHDSLTGLPNRRQLTQALADRVRLARRNAAPLSILIMDLDSFKEVNDSRGHQVGDLLLKSVARRLSRQLRAGDLVARLGGDEFAILPAPTAAPGSAAAIAQKIVSTFREPFSVGEAVIETGVSIGIASFPEHGEDADTLMRHADAAMYAAKRAGGGWATAVPGRQEDRPIIEAAVSPADLRRAVEDGELTLHYAPVMGLDGNALRGVDARVRWHHPDLGILEPGQFIPLAERSGVIRPLIRCTARLAVEQMAAWRGSGSEVSVSIAISERNLRDPDLVSTIAGLLHQHGLPADSLTLLATQDTALAPGAGAFFAAASEAGLRLAINEYGTGSVSLLRLHTMQFTEVRLATPLTSRLGSEAGGRAVVQAIIAMAHALGMTVTAKGVGDEPTLTLLRELGCDAVSFLRWSQPLPADAPAAAIDGAALHAALTGSTSMLSDTALVSALDRAEQG